MAVGPDRSGPHHTVPIPEPVELLRVHRKDMEAAFEQSFDNRASRHFDGHSYPLRLSSRQGPQPVRQPSQTGSIMVYNPFTHPASVPVEPIDLMLS